MDIITDNTSNNGLFVRLLTEWTNDKLIFFNNNKHYFRCFAHVINLSVQNYLNFLNNLYLIKLFNYFLTNLQLRKLIIKIHLSPLRHDKLSNICKNFGINDLKPILDVSTRWNSTFDMIERALILQNVSFYINLLIIYNNLLLILIL